MQPITQRTDSGFTVQNIVVSCASIDAVLEKLYEQEKFNPGIIVFSQADHDVVHEEVKALLAKDGHDMGPKLAPKLGGYENQTTGKLMHVIIHPGISQGTVKFH